jgi:hypothetical protein
MDVREARRRLEASAATIAAAVADVDGEEARFRPKPGAWSILEVMGHLGSEEVDDFRRRLASTLQDPTAAWPPLDPEETVRQGGFGERDLASLLASFTAARSVSLTYLAGLTESDLVATYHHPRGPIRAGDLLAAWVAHDLLHVRQIVKNRHAFWASRSAPFEVGYAGPW